MRSLDHNLSNILRPPTPRSHAHRESMNQLRVSLSARGEDHRPPLPRVATRRFNNASGIRFREVGDVYNGLDT